MSESSSSPSQWVLRVWEADMPEWMGRMETLRNIPRLTSSERELVVSFTEYLKEHEFLTPRQLEVLRRVAGRYGVELPPIPRPSASSPKAVRRRRFLKGTLYSKGAEHGQGSEVRVVGSYDYYVDAASEQDSMAEANPQYFYEVMEWDGVWELVEYKVSPEDSEHSIVASMTDEERGLIAGLIIGETHIMPYLVCRIRRGERVYYERRPRVDTTSIDMDVLERGKEIVGGGYILTRTRKEYDVTVDERVWHFGRTPVHSLRVEFGRAYDLLKQTQHLLVGTKMYRGKRYATRELARMVVEDPHYSMKVPPRWYITEEEYRRLRAG